MSLRARLTLAVAVAVAASIAIACGVVYVIVRNDLRGQVDDTLRNRAAAAQEAFNRPGFGRFFAPLGAGGGDTLIQLVQSNGTVVRAPYSVSIPVDRQTKLVAGGTANAYLTRTRPWTASTSASSPRRSARGSRSRCCARCRRSTAR